MLKLIALFIALVSFAHTSCAEYRGWDGGSTGGGQAAITASDQGVLYSSGANNPVTTDHATFYYDYTGHALHATSLQTAATSVPQVDFYPSLSGDTHWIWGLNGNGDGSSNDSLVLSEGSTLGSSNRISIAPGGAVTIPTLLGTTFNGLTLTSSSGVLTLASGKTLTANNTLTLAGTDSTTMTFPSTSATLARTDAANTFTGNQTLADGANIVLNTSTGSKIGTGTTQKLGFYNVTPIVQPTGNVCTAMQNLGLVASCTESGTSQWTTIGNDVYYSTGNVGIGTSTPAVPLQINGAVGAQKIFNTGADGSSSGAQILLYQDDAAFTTAGSRLGALFFGGVSNGTHNTSTSSGITAFAEEAFNGQSGTNMRFETTSIGAGSRSEAIRIAAGGNVGIGTTVVGNGHLQLPANGTASGKVMCFGTNNCVGYCTSLTAATGVCASCTCF